MRFKILLFIACFGVILIVAGAIFKVLHLLGSSALLVGGMTFMAVGGVGLAVNAFLTKPE